MYYSCYGTIGKVVSGSFTEDDPAVHSAVLLDSMAHRYGMLPSQVLEHANTQDVYVFDMANTYKSYQMEKQEKKSKHKNAEPQQMTPDLLERYEKFKNANKDR